MQSTLPQYIEIRQNRDGQDRPYVVGTRVRVQDIVIYHERFGFPADEIASHHLPHLSLAQVHAALTFYNEDREAIRECIREDEKYIEACRSAQEAERMTPGGGASDGVDP